MSHWRSPELLAASKAAVLAASLLLTAAAAGPAADPDWHITPAAEDTGTAVSHPAYLRLLQARQRQAALLADGGWPELVGGPGLRPGQRDPAVRKLRERLRASGDFRGQIDADPWFFDGQLQEALEHFQRRHGLPPTGWLDEQSHAAASVSARDRLAQMDAALERWHWLPRELGARHIWVNLPAATLELVEDGEVALTMAVIVGHPSRPTPALHSEIRAIEFRPSWTVPRSIAVEDLLPLQQQDPEFLARQDIRVTHLTAQGPRPVAIGDVPWARLSPDYFPYVLTQAAGPENSLGLLKFVMDNPFDIYLHDTPARGFFRLNRRTLSAGCIRLAEPFRLADALLGKDREDWLPGTAASRSGTGGQERLAERLPVWLVYFTSWVDEDGTVQFRPDIYGRDEPLLAARQ